ncbi:hypothetical protein Tco_0718798 [Tanacetum coccineum]
MSKPYAYFYLMILDNITGGPFLPLVEPEAASLPLVWVGLSTSQPPPYTVEDGIGTHNPSKTVLGVTYLLTHTLCSNKRVMRSAHRILHNLFKSSIQATMSGEAIKSENKLQTFNLHVKANDIKQNKTHLTCGICGMSRHTTYQCFELIGYPDWWNDGHKKGNKNRGLERGKASAANTGTDRKNSTVLGGMAATTVNEEDDPSQ